MAMAGLFDSPIDRLEDAILFALDKTGRTGITIKPEQREAIYNLVVVGRRCFGCASKWFGKSLLNFANFLTSDYTNTAFAWPLVLRPPKYPTVTHNVPFKFNGLQPVY